MGQHDPPKIMKKVVADFVLVLDNPAKPFTPPAAPPQAAGMKEILFDDFMSSTLDLTKWGVGTKPDGNQWGSDAYFSVLGDEWFDRCYSIPQPGSLRLRALSVPNLKDPVPGWKQTWVSGLIHTNKFPFRKGAIEARVLFPKGTGVWPAIWALNQSMSDSSGGVELDMEYYGEGPNSQNLQTGLHDWTPKPQKDGPKSCGGPAQNQPPDWTAGFHTLLGVVDDTHYTVFIDSMQAAQWPLPSRLGKDKFFWMINMAMGGGWPTEIPPAGYYDLWVNYVRVYSAD